MTSRRALCAALRRTVGAVVGAAISCAAYAWEAEGFRSGMTLADAMAVAMSHGESVDFRYGIDGGPNNAFGVALKSNRPMALGQKLPSGEVITRSLSFCNNVLYMHLRSLPGGFEAFVRHVEMETGRRGSPTLRSFSQNMSIAADWSIGTERFTVFVEKFEGQLRLQTEHEDLGRCPRN